MIIVNEYEELMSQISKYIDKPQYVFRGQVTSYSTNDSQYSFSTSFERHICSPSAKFKWEYYCYSALKMVLGKEVYENLSYKDMLIYVDALLQHYGWRSMQLDVSKSFDVSLFFSSHSFNQTKKLHLTEDCHENPVIDIINESFYSESTNEYGFIYIFDKEKLVADSDVNFIDLTAVANLNDCRPVRQMGCVISTFPNPINISMNRAIVEVIQIKTEYALRYCKINEITQSYLFPSESEDYIYSFLISLPRKEFVTNGERTGFFAKELAIPEYNIEYKKIRSPATAFYSTFWIYDNIKSFEKDARNNKRGVIYYKCIADIFNLFSKEGNYLEMPYFIDLLKQENDIILEFDNIYRHYSTSQTEYQKGIHYTLNDDVISVSEIIIEYAGKEILGFGELLPRYYKIISTSEVAPVRIEGDCPCDDHDRHLHKLLVGKYFAHMLSDESLKRSRERKNVFVVQ